MKFGLWHTRDKYWIHNMPNQPMRCSLSWAEIFLKLLKKEGRDSEFEIKRWLDGWNFVSRDSEAIA